MLDAQASEVPDPTTTVVVGMVLEVEFEFNRRCHVGLVRAVYVTSHVSSTRPWWRHARTHALLTTVAPRVRILTLSPQPLSKS